MGIISLVTDLPAQIGDRPRRPKLISSDNLATITAAGYLNQYNLQGQVILSTDVIDAYYSYVNSLSPGVYEEFTVSIVNGVITLVPAISNVLLPVVSGDFAVFSGTTGQIKDSGIASSSATNSFVVTSPGATIVNHIATYSNVNGAISEDAPIAINGGSIQAGLSGTAGTLASYPATAARGALILAAVANAGNTNTILSNVSMAQASQINIPDPGNVIGELLIAATATPFTSGHIPSASGSSGLMVDSGILSSNIMLLSALNTLTSGAGIVLPKVNGTEAANVVTASGVAGVITTSSLTTAGGANYVITWTNTFITATSVIRLTVQGGTNNATQNITLTVVPGAGSATITIYNNTAATALNGTLFLGYTVF